MPSERARRTLRHLPGRVPGAPPWWLAAVAAAVLTYTAVDVARRGWLTDVDSNISRGVRGLHLPAHGVGHVLLYLLTWFGQRGPVLVATAAAVGYVAWRARRAEPALRYVVALLLLAAVVYALKYGIPRTAPSYTPGKPDPRQSFPSGHMVNAVLLWGVAAWSAPRFAAPRALVQALRVVRVIAPIAVFGAMTLLNYHWFSDFLAGACIAVVLLPIVLHPGWSRPARWLDRRLWSRPVTRPTRPSAKLGRS